MSDRDHSHYGEAADSADVGVCGHGDVLIILRRNDGTRIGHASFSAESATEFFLALGKAIELASAMEANLPGVAGGDPTLPCTKH